MGPFSGYSGLNQGACCALQTPSCTIAHTVWSPTGPHPRSWPARYVRRVDAMAGPRLDSPWALPHRYRGPEVDIRHRIARKGSSPQPGELPHAVANSPTGIPQSRDAPVATCRLSQGTDRGQGDARAGSSAVQGRTPWPPRIREPLGDCLQPPRSERPCAERLLVARTGFGTIPRCRGMTGWSASRWSMTIP